jgi:DNA-binding MurR/RpiR family transcriptional regulator
MPLIDQIREVYDELPGTERALADLLLEFPGDITVYSATELAARASVSNAAVSRLVKRLGFPDYRAARQAVRAAQASGQPIYLNNSLVAPPNQGRSLEQQIEQDVRNLHATYESIDTQAVATAIKAIMKAKNVWCIGFRNSHFFAAYLRRQLNQSRSGLQLLPLPGQVLMEDLAAAGPKDVVIVVGLRRRSSLTAKAMAFLSSREVPIIYVTDHRAVGTAKLATWTFRCHTRGVSLFDSYVSVISLLNYICIELAAEAGDRGRRRLEEIEIALDFSEEIEAGN